MDPNVKWVLVVTKMLGFNLVWVHAQQLTGMLTNQVKLEVMFLVLSRWGTRDVGQLLDWITEFLLSSLISHMHLWSLWHTSVLKIYLIVFARQIITPKESVLTVLLLVGQCYLYPGYIKTVITGTLTTIDLCTQVISGFQTVQKRSENRNHCA